MHSLINSEYCYGSWNWLNSQVTPCSSATIQEIPSFYAVQTSITVLAKPATGACPEFNQTFPHYPTPVNRDEKTEYILNGVITLCIDSIIIYYMYIYYIYI
jgi:hypothetical protein